MKSPADPSGIIEAIGTPVRASDRPLPLFRPKLWFSLFDTGDYEVDTGGEDATSVVLQLSGGVEIERRVDRSISTKHAALGLVTVTDPEIRARWRVSGRSRTLHIWLPRSELRAAAGEGRPCSITSRFSENDRGLQRCAHRALVALNDGEVVSPLFLSSLALQVSLNLLTRPPEGSARASGGLSRSHARRVEEFLRSRAGDTTGASPTLSELAEETGLSLFHFSRQFRSTFGASPHAYSLKLRLERALDLLARTAMPVAEVASQTGFASPAHFGERFRREMGVTPGALRRGLRD